MVVNSHCFLGKHNQERQFLTFWKGGGVPQKLKLLATLNMTIFTLMQEVNSLESDNPLKHFKLFPTVCSPCFETQKQMQRVCKSCTGKNAYMFLLLLKNVVGLQSNSEIMTITAFLKPACKLGACVHCVNTV